MAAVDTPVPRPPSRLERVKAFLGDLARPFSIMSIAGASAGSIVIVSVKGLDYTGAALLVGAELGGLAALYWGKAWENQKVNAQAAVVEKAKVESGQTDGSPPASGNSLVGGDTPIEPISDDDASADTAPLPDSPPGQR